MTKEQPRKPETGQAQQQKARLLAASGLAGFVGSYLACGCLLPVVALAVVTGWLLYRGGTVVLVTAALVAVGAFVVWLFERAR